MWGNIIGGGLALGGALIGSSAANKAAKAGAQASDNAARAQINMYNQSREDASPYRQSGYNALLGLADLTGTARFDGSASGPGVTATPGYQFRLGEGLRAIDRTAAARGMSMSGAQMRAAQRYGEGLAADEQTQQFNRLAALAGIGQTATSHTGSLGASAAAGAGNAMMAGGAARGSGYVGGANAISGGINNALLYNYIYGSK